jgi:hypothetical protein
MDEFINFVTTFVSTGIALTNAVATSIALISLGGMLQPFFTIVPASIYTILMYSCFVTSVISWFSIHFSKIHKYLKHRITPESNQDIAKRVIKEADNELKKINAYLIKIGEKNITKAAFESILTTKINLLTNTTEGQSRKATATHLQLMHESSWGEKIYRLAYRSSLLKFLLPQLSIHEKHERYVDVCKNLQSILEKRIEENTDENDPLSPKAHHQVVSVIYDQILSKLPEHPTDNSNTQASNFLLNKLSYLKTSFYTLFSNTAIIVIFSGLEFLALIGPTSPIVSIGIILCFMVSGYVSSNGLEKPAVDTYQRLKNTLSQQSKALIKKMRAKSQRISMLNMGHRSRDMLAYIISITAGISYFMASTAFVELLLGNIAVTNTALIIKIALSPIYASLPAIIIGAISGWVAFDVISSMLHSQSIMLPNATEPNIIGNSFKRTIGIFAFSTTFSFALICILSVFYATFTVSAIIPYMGAAACCGIAAAISKTIYDFSIEEHHALLTRAIFTTGLIVNILAGSILSALPGSIYNRLLGRIPAIAIGITTAAAQAEHVSPLFMNAAKDFDANVYNKPSQQPKKVAVGG